MRAVRSGETMRGRRVWLAAGAGLAGLAMLAWGILPEGANGRISGANEVAAAAPSARAPAQGLRFEFSFPRGMSAAPLDGRLFLLVSTKEKPEPRFAVDDQPDTQQMFAMDVNGWAPETKITMDGTALGYPVDSIAQIPPGDYTVQGLLNTYETFHRADGATVKLPMDRGEGQQWNLKPGNLLSTPRSVHVDSAGGGAIQIELGSKIPPVNPPEDTKYVKHIHMQSALLTKFWGRPMELGAIVMLPAGWETHPKAHYPLLVWHGHFQEDFAWPDHPPGDELRGPRRAAMETRYKLYQDWSEGRLPKMIVVIIQHANPYYDDSYAVDSANVGPYGSAIMKELIPAVEKQFRGIGQGWARTLLGGSTGGWEALASQVFYPDDFNGAWCMCPDPVDFRAYQIVNLYDDKNALWIEGPWSRVPRPAVREVDGSVVTTMDRENRRELVLGTHGRSTEQFNIWQAVFSPLGEDGYPREIWNPATGEIDHQVAQYWREHYDLHNIMERDWKTLGPKLVGKLHIRVGTRDTYYLDNAVRLLEEWMKTTQNPHYVADFEYGPHQPHCYTGPPDQPAGIGTRTMLQRTLPAAAEWITKSAPAGADMTWKY
jgi:hypothetical protein